MEQLLIVEDDIGLNQGLCKALKADARQIISCQDLKAAKERAEEAAPDWVWKSETPPNLLEELTGEREKRHAGGPHF